MLLVQSCKLCNHKYASNIKQHKGNKKTYNTDLQLPRILSCGHTFCDKCILTRLLVPAEDDQSNETCNAVCPYDDCQAKTQLPTKDDVKCLEINMFMIGALYVDSELQKMNERKLLDLLDKSTNDLLLPTTNTTQEKCANCQTEVAVLRCDQCSVSLCQQCFSIVHQSRVLSSHKPTYIEQKIQSTIDLQSSEMCAEHTDRRREYFCEDCSASMCADCGVLGSHPGHKLQRLETVNQRMKPSLLETRAKAGKTLDLVHQTKSMLATELSQDSTHGASTNPTLLRVDEVFTRLHAMLQLKHHEIAESVLKCTGNDTYLLKSMEEEVSASGRKIEHLLAELDRILGNPSYEKSCDFTMINTAAQGAFSLPCHLMVNNVTECSDIKMEINEELIESLSKDLVTVVTQSPTLNRFELVSIDKVSEDVISSCPQMRRTPSQHSMSSSQRQPPVGMHSDHPNLPIHTLSVGRDGHHQQPSMISPGSSHDSLSRQSSTNSHHLSDITSVSRQLRNHPGGAFDPYSSPYAQQHPTTNRNHDPHHLQNFYEDVDAGNFFPDDPYAIPSLEKASQSLRSPGSSYGSYDPYAFPTAATNTRHSTDTHYTPQMVRDYNHRQPIGAKTGSQDARLEPPPTTGAIYENYEQSARQFRDDYQKSGPPAYHPQQHEFRNRDVRLLDAHYQQSPDFTVCREGAVPMSEQFNYSHTQPVQYGAKKSSSKSKAVGRGRGAPAPVFAPPPGPHSNFQESHKKKLFMYNPEPITERSCQIYISYIESPGCFYVQHPGRQKALKKLQQRYNEHCNVQPALNDLHNVKYLFAKVSGAWCRAEVKKVMDRSVIVYCVDYGHTSTVKCRDLRPAIGSLLALPKVAVKCFLQGIQPADGGNDWLGDTSQMMLEVLSYCKTVVLVKLDSPLIEDEAMPVDLLMRDQAGTSLLSMRDYLVFIEKAVWDSPVSPYIPDNQLLNQTYLKPVPLNDGDYMYVYITHVENPNELYCQMAHRIREDMTGPGDPNPEIIQLETIMRAMNEKYKTASSHLVHKVFVPKSGLAVAASYEGDWYRAQILSLQPGHVKVKYIDYGNTEIIPADLIRILTRDFQQLPAQAVCLSIHGVSPLTEKGWSDKICAGLKQLCSDKHCKAKVMTGTRSQEGLSMILNIDGTHENVADVLVKHGLAKRSVEDIVEEEGVGCACTYVESPGEFYVMPLHLKEQYSSMTSELNSIMNEAGDQSSEASDIKWSVMDNCVVKHGKNWVRAIIEELKPDHDRCRLRLIDIGTPISKPLSSLRPHPDIDCLSGPAMSTLTSISGIIPAGGSTEWGLTAKETIKELIEGQESCRVIPQGQATDVLPCDVLLAEELPSKIQGLPGEIQYISVKSRLLDMGVALRGQSKQLPKISPKKASSTSSKSSSNTVKQSPVTSRRACSALNYPPQSQSPPESTPSLTSVSDNEHQAFSSSQSVTSNDPAASQSQTHTNQPSQSQISVQSHDTQSNQQYDSGLPDSLQHESMTYTGDQDQRYLDDSHDTDEMINIGESPKKPVSMPPMLQNLQRQSQNFTEQMPPLQAESTSLSYARVASGNIPGCMGDAQNKPAGSIMKNSTGRRLAKSPGGTITSSFSDVPNVDPTEKLLSAAASALSLDSKQSPRQWHETSADSNQDKVVSGSSSDDIPTPELMATLNKMVGQPANT